MATRTTPITIIVCPVCKTEEKEMNTCDNDCGTYQCRACEEEFHTFDGEYVIGHIKACAGEEDEQDDITHN